MTVYVTIYADKTRASVRLMDTTTGDAIGSQHIVDVGKTYSTTAFDNVCVIVEEFLPFANFQKSVMLGNDNTDNDAYMADVV